MTLNADGAKRPRKAQKAETRTAIVEAARQCFAARGYGETGIAEIARAAEIAHGTFYVHFANKGAVADELLSEFNERLAAELGPALLAAGSDTGLEPVVRRAVRVFFDALQAERAFVGWYAERLAESITPTALREGINPPAQTLLAVALARVSGKTEAGEEERLAAGALLALWIRVGLQLVLGEAVSRRVAEDVLVKLTSGAVLAFCGKANSGRPGPRKRSSP